MQWKINKSLIKKYDLDIGTVYFYQNYVVTEIKEGMLLNYEKAGQLLLLGKEYYGNNVPFVYISNRIHSYSFEPTDHFKSTELFPNLKGYAVITHNVIGNKIAELEQAFLNTPTQIFDSLEEAIIWVEQLISHD
ncbi:STAS/SEC14 domain-containing protein [Aquimarina sp. I32.4]|uniref:STAS/SEC14 domain-containing protein n=1 Tax=Aquimarina sp. I32.4 TaxID=2053903 RepID=UPI000CDEEDA0|nr:STAS/SEC14 domain-containing protein [Aquimarina sp. I32.4]